MMCATSWWRKDGEFERIELISAIMGGLRHFDFYPYLERTLKKLDSGKRQRAESIVIEALGRIGHPKAAELLLERLQYTVKKTGDPVQEDRA